MAWQQGIGRWAVTVRVIASAADISPRTVCTRHIFFCQNGAIDQSATKCRYLHALRVFFTGKTK
jgi:hypothetical protein